jgi:hypothetical protein
VRLALVDVVILVAPVRPAGADQASAQKTRGHFLQGKAFQKAGDHAQAAKDGDNRDSSLKAEVCQDSCLIASG